jgi:hypothetical protein
MCRFRILQKLPSKEVASIEDAMSLDDAKKRIKQLEVMFPGDYFIFDIENQCLMIPVSTRGRIP